MKTHPYLILGLGSRPWTTYSIENGVAYTRTWPNESRSIPLADAKFDASNSVLDFGTISIQSGGDRLEWTNVKERSKVLRALEIARSIDPTNMHDLQKHECAFYLQELHRGEAFVFFPDKTVVWSSLGEPDIASEWHHIRKWLNKSHSHKGTWRLRGAALSLSITSPMHTIRYEGEFLGDRLVLRSSDKPNGPPATYLSLPSQGQSLGLEALPS